MEVSSNTVEVREPQNGILNQVQIADKDQRVEVVLESNDDDVDNDEGWDV